MLRRSELRDLERERLYKKHDIVPQPYRGEVHPKCYAWAQSKKAA
jgi:hypothetical protein